jgi:hypothetical protein
VWRKEDVLELYEEPHGPNNPVVCFDELPYQMVAETRTPISAKPGRPLRCDYEYEHKGTCYLCVNPIVQTAHIINFRPSGYVTLRIRGEGPRPPTGGPAREAIAVSAVVPTPASSGRLRVILARAYCQASQAIAFSYMMGTWVAWHIRRRP